MIKYIKLNFLYSDTGYLHNIYKSETGFYYCLQWDNGYDNAPTLCTATKDGEANTPIRKKESIEKFIFPEGHEHYHYIIKESFEKGCAIT